MRKTLVLLAFVVSLLLLFASCGVTVCEHGNTEVQGAKAATCTEAGHTGKTVCKDCTETIDEGKVIPASGSHSYDGGVITTQATCTTDGVKTFTCTRTGCSATKTEPIAATGHTSQSPKVYGYDADTHWEICGTCNQKMTETAVSHTPGAAATEEVPQKCTVCDKVLTPATHATHTYTKVDAVEPDCATRTNGTAEHYTCTCGRFFVLEGTAYVEVDEEDLVIPVQHTMETVETVDPTCTELGYTVIGCVDCGFSYRQYEENAAALGHSYGEWTVTLEATCKAAGETAHTCSRCGDVETIALSVNPKAHQYDNGSITKQPTCCEEGVRTYMCTICGDRSKTASVAKTAHEYDAGVADGETGWVTQTCQTCPTETAVTRKYYDASTLQTAKLEVQDIPKDQDLELGMENATLALPKEVIDQLGEAEEVEIKAEFVDTTTKAGLLAKPTMTDEQRARLENEEIYDFGILVGEQSIGDFSATVTVTIPYTLKDGEDAEGIQIWYVKDNGEIETVTAVYNETTETVTFSVSHFSYYAVAYEETQAMKCRRGVHDLVATDRSATASCTSYGYTVFECSYCHYEEFGNFVDKKDHAWGAVQQPEVTCTEGGYTYKVCADCETEMHLAYVSALGHSAKGEPTCEKGVSCSACGELVKLPLGHSFGEWAVTVEPTPTTEGEKARTCATCGKKESVRLAPEGTVEAYEFKTIDDYYIFFFREFTGLEKGQFSLAFDMNGMKANVAVNFDTTNDKLVFVMQSVTETPTGPDTTSASYTDVYYDGAKVFVYNDGDVMVQDLEAMMSTEGITIELIYGLMEEAFDMVNPMVEPYFALATEALALLPDSAAAKLAGYVDSIRTVYAYYALRLGFDTNIEMVDGVKIPTPKDYKNIVEALMVEDEENPGTYTFSAETIYALIDDVCAYLDANAETAVGTIVYEMLADSISEIYPDVTSYETFFAKLKTEFPGEMTVKDALLKLVQMALTTDMTLQDVYEVIDLVMNAGAPEGADKVSSEEMLAMYFDMTLNDLVTGLMADPESEEPPTPVTVEELLTMVEQMGMVKLGEVEIPVPPMSEGAEPMMLTSAMISGMLQQIKAQFALTLDMSVVFDAAGNLVSVNVGLGVGMNPPADAPAGTKPMEMLSGAVTFSNVADLTPPLTLDEYVGIDVKASFDDKGNLVVSGIDSDIAFVFDVFGDHVYKLSELLVKDEEMSKEYGYEVYKLEARYSSKSYNTKQLCKINGKYYRYEDVEGFLTETKETERVALNELLKNPTAYLPDETAERIGIVAGTYINEDYNEKGEAALADAPSVYLTAAGFVYQQDGEWYLIDANTSSYENRYFWNSETDEDIRLFVFDPEGLNRIPYSALADARFITYTESLESFGYGGYEWMLCAIYGNKFVNNYSYVTLETEGGLYYLLADVTDNGIDVIAGENRLNESGYYYSVKEVVDLTKLEALFDSAYGSEIYIDTEDGWWTTGTFVLNGVVYTGRMELLHVELHTPEYFRKIEDGTYVSLGMSGKGGSGIGFADISHIERTVTAANGKTLYVKGENDTYYYGYVALSEGEYIQACIEKETNLLVYRDQKSEIRANLYDIFDVEDYVTKNALGNYVISAELFEALSELLSEDESYYIALMNKETDLGDDNMLRIEIPVYSTVKELDVTLNDALAGMMGGSSSGKEDYMDWWQWFDMDASYYGIHVVPNADGTVSIYSPYGEQLKFSYHGKEFPVDPYAVKDEALSAETGYDIYKATMTQTNTTWYYVKLNEKYYHYSIVDEHDISYFSGAAQINCKNWELQRLTLAIPADPEADVNDPENERNPYDIFIGDVYFEALSGTKEFYFIYDGGVLKVLTGVVRQDGATDAIVYEGAVEADAYFSALKLELRTAEAWSSYDVTVNGRDLTIYYVPVYFIEPASLGGFAVDTRIEYLYSDIKAVKNGNRFTYVKSISSQGEPTLVFGNEYVPEKDYVESYSYTSRYENGTFEFVQFRYVSEETREYIKIAGKLYVKDWWWNNNIYSAETVKQNLFDSVYLWVKEGTDEVLLYVDGSLVPYEDQYGALELSDADVVNEEVYDGADTYTEYVFYVSTPDVPVATGEINGCKAFYNENTLQGYVEVKPGCNTYAEAYFGFNEESALEVVHISWYTLATASSEMIEGSTAIKDCITFMNNGRVAVLDAEILELLVGEFDIEVRTADDSSWIGSVSSDRLYEAFAMADGLKNSK